MIIQIIKERERLRDLHFLYQEGSGAWDATYYTCPGRSRFVALSVQFGK